MPLLVLTADRPPELREVGAGQAIDQIKLYGDAAQVVLRGRHARGDARARALDAHARLPRRAGRRSTAGPGPVHLNFPLREPLVLDAPLPAADRAPAAAPDGAPGSRTPVARADRSAAGRARARAPARGVVVAGRDERDPTLGAAVGGVRRARRLAAARRPAVAARAAAPPPSRTTTRCCATPPSPPPTRPDVVLRVGDLPTSKPLRAWLAGPADAEQVALDRRRRLAGPGRDADLAPRRTSPRRAGALRRAPRTPTPAGWTRWRGRRRARPRRRSRRCSATS